jgi:hypothetical protein
MNSLTLVGKVTAKKILSNSSLEEARRILEFLRWKKQ